MSEPDEQHESDYECPGCHQQYAGPWSLYNHTLNCQKALFLEETPKTEDCERCGGWGWIDGDDQQGDCPDCKP